MEDQDNVKSEALTGFGCAPSYDVPFYRLRSLELAVGIHHPGDHHSDIIGTAEALAEFILGD